MKILHCLFIITLLFVFAQSLASSREEALVREIEGLKKHKDDSYQEYLRAWRQLEDAKTDVKDDLRQSYETTNNQYQQSRDKFVTQIKQALDAAKAKYQQEKEQLRKTVQDLKAYKNEKKGEAQQVYDNTKEDLLKPFHLSQEKYRAAKNTLSKYYNRVYDELYADYEKAKELASSAKTQYARDEAQKLYTSAKTNLRDAYDRVVEFGEGSLDTARDVIDSLKDYSQYYSQKVVEKTKDGIEAAKQTVAEGLEAAKQATENLKQNAAEGVDSAKQAASDNLNSAQQTVSQGVESAKQSASRGAETAQQKTSEGIESVKETASNFYSTLEQEYESAKTQAADFLERAKIWLTEDDNVHQAKTHATHDTANPHLNPHLHQDL